MVSLEETYQTTPKHPIVEPISSPRTSFSAEFLDESHFISICPNREKQKDGGKEMKPAATARNPDFEFLSGNLTNMLSADELFREGKLLPFWQTRHAEKLDKLTLKTSDNGGPEDKDLAERNNDDDDDRRISWFLDDDPSPRPPKCTVLWKELLRLKKQRASTLSPSSSSSSSSTGGSLAEKLSGDERKRKGVGNKEKVVSRVKKGVERTRSASIRIRPMVNVPICSQGKNTSLPPLFSLRRGKLD